MKRRHDAECQYVQHQILIVETRERLLLIAVRSGVNLNQFSRRIREINMK